ncbi:ATP-binding protein [Streptomyces sp. NPDC014623]|uniref:ATP-binding protein n=1 Tax=Streptomyces sp. NPDC014623 TaxID=3364875 RepID=UPI0036F6643F
MAADDRSMEGHESARDAGATASAAYDMDSEQISHARAFARQFLTREQAVHSLPVSARALEVTQLVISELATNVCKYAPGPCLLDLQIHGTMLDITMWDSGPVLPTAREQDPTRAGQHGLEIVLALCHSFEIRREPVGKRIRVQLALQDDPHHDPAGRSPWHLT